MCYVKISLIDAWTLSESFTIDISLYRIFVCYIPLYDAAVF